MKQKARLRRLLDRKVVSTLLDGYTSLLGQSVSLSLVDAQGRQLVGRAEINETELTRLWERVREGEASVAPSEKVAAWPIIVADRPLGMLLITGTLPANLEIVVPLLVLTLETLAAEAVAKRAIAQETLDRYREINVLYNIGETLGACLELDEVCRLVLAESVKLINCRRGAVFLIEPDEQGRLESLSLFLAAGVGVTNLSDQIIQESLSVAMDVVRRGRPQIVNDFQPQGLPRMPIVCAPLRFQDEILGAILLTDKATRSDFTAADERLLFTLATQAASSIENARLFESVKRQRDEITVIKNYMDNIFASIASGVITTDEENNITTFNRAAESILDQSAQTVLQRPYQQVLAFLNDTPLPKLIEDVHRTGQTYIDYEISPYLDPRGQVHLSTSLSRLRGSSEEPLGVTIVVDDVTEKKRFERERSMVRRYLPPELVDSLPDLEELKLRGERQTVTTLFADIRGFTSFSEIHSPERVVEVINRYFALAAEAVRKHHGIVDKYLGDAVMAVFNTPLLESKDHAWDAVQAAWELKQMIDQYHHEVGPELRMNFGMGICTGEAVVGNVGTIDRMEYTAIGDAVNVAKRLQESAAAGEIVMSGSTWERLQDRIRASQLSPVKLKGRRTPTDVFKLEDLRA